MRRGPAFLGALLLLLLLLPRGPRRTELACRRAACRHVRRTEGEKSPPLEGIIGMAWRGVKMDEDDGPGRKALRILCEGTTGCGAFDMDAVGRRMYWAEPRLYIPVIHSSIDSLLSYKNDTLINKTP